MADKSSRDGGSGLGWFIIGLLIGVAGTLATQRFAVFKGAEAASDLAAPALQPPSQPLLAGGQPKLIVHKGGLTRAPVSAASAAPLTTRDVAIDEAPSEVADDAAATGMTARAKPQKPPAN
jgi:hypothetical protein